MPGTTASTSRARKSRCRTNRDWGLGPKALKQPMGAIIGKLRFDRLVSPLDETGLGASDARNIRAVADSQLINAGELRDTLERGGHRFPMRTDAELIAHA